MKLLLTSGGVTNESIRDALVHLLGKPIAASTALCIPTAAYAHPMAGPVAAYRFVVDHGSTPLTGLGWASLGVLELTALASSGQDWVPEVKAVDALLVGGGEAMYLGHWIRESGLADLLPSLRDTVYVGASAGSMVLTPDVGSDFVHWRRDKGSTKGLGVVDFSIFPHLDHPSLPENTLANARSWAARLPVPAYAIDDATAIRVNDGKVDVISEGHWTQLQD